MFTAVVSLVSVLAVRPLMGWLLCYPAGLGLFGAWLGLLSDQFSAVFDDLSALWQRELDEPEGIERGVVYGKGGCAGRRAVV